MKAFLMGLAFITTSSLALAEAAATAGYVIENEAAIAEQQPGPHKGGGETTGYPFFADVPAMDLVFKKRVLHPGSAIGYHEQHKDEIYYVVSGTGELTMNGERSKVGPGTAILTRPGNSHGLRQIGNEDLVIFIVYRKDAQQ
ncbi:Cupin domain-containing protein [Microbulbifer donghaiensis]|uniref:Cupin domain-containing protein n=1 Tax=Microbulbifer donghaiensis TaxID=494016 RepID=A0A1M5FNS7_9GAMM|nr:cupin domain-containing protein [Microbulbifer donghaiensis]SHF93079.1 Cupin domain-containing protein [Microbulbifer donghaiensis]